MYILHSTTLLDTLAVDPLPLLNERSIVRLPKVTGQYCRTVQCFDSVVASQTSNGPFISAVYATNATRNGIEWIAHFLPSTMYAQTFLSYWIWIKSKTNVSMWCIQFAHILRGFGIQRTLLKEKKAEKIIRLEEWSFCIFFSGCSHLQSLSFLHFIDRSIRQTIEANLITVRAM